jgi:hypothetical protein
MVMLAVAATIHWLVAAAGALPTDPLSQQVLARVANPLLTSAQFLIPAAVAISGIHKMMEHRAGAVWDRPGQHDPQQPWVQNHPAGHQRPRDLRGAGEVDRSIGVHGATGELGRRWTDQPLVLDAS